MGFEKLSRRSFAFREDRIEPVSALDCDDDVREADEGGRTSQDESSLATPSRPENALAGESLEDFREKGSWKPGQMGEGTDPQPLSAGSRGIEMDERDQGDLRGSGEQGHQPRLISTVRPGT